MISKGEYPTAVMALTSIGVYPQLLQEDAWSILLGLFHAPLVEE
jgi:hypothetical protein